MSPQLRRKLNIIIVLLIIIIIGILFGCKPKPTTDTVVKQDSVITETCCPMVSHLNIQLTTIKDSVKVYKDSMSLYKDSVQIYATRFRIADKEAITLRENLAVSDYKLLRIREYNRIAAQNNNLKYLRGWLNRVLND